MIGHGIPRKDPYLNEALDILELHFRRCKGDYAEAFGTLTHEESEFINEEIESCASDPIYYLENYYVVKSKISGIKTLFPLWDSQLIFYQELKELELTGKPRKVLVLKARQLGLSTISEGLVFHKTIFNHAINSLIVAQDPGQADYLFSMFTGAYDSLPWWMKPEVLYRAKGRYMVFDTDRPDRSGLKSEIFVEAANKMTGVSVGKAINAAHLSELSDWDNAETLTQQIFPATGGRESLIILESTARGRHGFWYDFWRKSVQKWGNGTWEWKPIFIEWFRCSDQYSKVIEPKVKFSVSDDERDFRKKALNETGFFIPDEMFYWRRSKMEETRSLEGDEWGFYQEYPSNWMEAFQASGICAFDKRKLHKLINTTCMNPLWIGEVHYHHGAQQEVRFSSSDSGPELHATTPDEDIPGTDDVGARLRVWEKPEPGQGYYLAADPAGGMEGGDYSCCQLFRIGHGGCPDEQVAEWHGWINPTPFAHVIVGLAKWYNNAEVALELNSGFGEKCYIEMFRILNYPNLFRWKHYDKLKNYYTDYLGWVTNSKTRDLIIASMAERVLENTIRIRSTALIDEMLAFAQDEGGGRFEGRGTKDDRVMAAMICVWCAHDSDYGKEVASRPSNGTEGVKYLVFDENGKLVKECDERNTAWALAMQHSGWSFRRNLMRKDFSNSDFSPVHDRSGPRATMHYEMGIPAEQISAATLVETSGDEVDWRNV
jgi:hypothetical protein